MCSYKFYEYDSGWIIYFDNKTVFISGDIEYHFISHETGMTIFGFDIVWRSPFRFDRFMVPCLQ